MSTLVEVENTANLAKAKALTGAKSDGEAVDLALEKLIEVYEPHNKERISEDLPEECWDELFLQPPIKSSLVDRIIREEREDRF